MRFLSTSTNATKKYAYIMGRLLLDASIKTNHAFIIGLQGNLGSGKTTFVQGLTKGLKVRARVTSPTFIICRSHVIRGKQFKRLFHMDAYRIRSQKELGVLAFNAMIHDPSHIVVIEWADQIRGALPKNTLSIQFLYGKKDGARMIQIKKPSTRRS